MYMYNVTFYSFILRAYKTAFTLFFALPLFLIIWGNTEGVYEDLEVPLKVRLAVQEEYMYFVKN